MTSWQQKSARNSNWNWDSFRPGDCGQRRFATAARVYCTIGNTVNVASRIQGLRKTVGRPLLVTEAVRERSADSFVFEKLPSQEVCGIEGRMIIFAVAV